MKVVLLIFGVMACPKAFLTNESDFPINARDKKEFKHILKTEDRCEKVTRGQLPCIIKVIKKSELKYKIICGTKTLIEDRK